MNYNLKQEKFTASGQFWWNASQVNGIKNGIIRTSLLEKKIFKNEKLYSLMKYKTASYMNIRRAADADVVI